MLEGIEAMQHPETLEQHVAELNKAADKRVPALRPFSIARYWYAAAAVLVVASLAFYVYRTRTQPLIAIQQKPERTTQTVPEAGQETIRNTEATKPEQTVKRNTQPSVQPEANEAVGVSALNASAPEAVADKPEPAKQLTDELAASHQDNDAKMAQQEESKAESEEPVAAKIPAAKSKEIQAAPQSMQARSMNAVSGLASNGLTAPDSLALRAAALHFEEKKYDNSLADLSPLLNHPSSPYYEDALLMAAKIYIAKNQKAAAINYLETLRNLKGKHAAEAERLLK